MCGEFWRVSNLPLSPHIADELKAETRFAGSGSDAAPDDGQGD